MNLERFSAAVKSKIAGYEKVWGKDQRALHLVEEVGEFAEILLQFNGYKEPRKDIADIRIALADILEDVLALSLLYGIDIKDLFAEVAYAKE